MLAASFGITFFLKTPRRETNEKMIYLRITVDVIPKKTSTRRKWDATRWDQGEERATGNREDARTTNFFLDTLQNKVHQYKNELIYAGKPVTNLKLIEYVLGKQLPKLQSCRSSSFTMMNFWH